MLGDITEQRDCFITNELKKARLAADIEISQLAEILCINEEEYEAYEMGEKPMPASVAYFISIVLLKEPFGIMDQSENISTSSASNGVEAAQNT